MYGILFFNEIINEQWLIGFIMILIRIYLLTNEVDEHIFVHHKERVGDYNTRRFNYQRCVHMNERVKQALHYVTFPKVRISFFDFVCT